VRKSVVEQHLKKKIILDNAIKIKRINFKKTQSFKPRIYRAQIAGFSAALEPA
jgi:hypothetical protein